MTRQLIAPQKPFGTGIRTARGRAINALRAGIVFSGVSMHVRRAAECLATRGANVAAGKKGPNSWRLQGWSGSRDGGGERGWWADDGWGRRDGYKRQQCWAVGLISADDR